MSIISTRLLISDKKRQFLDLKIGNAMMQKVTRMETSQVRTSAFKTYTFWACLLVLIALLPVNLFYLLYNDVIQWGCETTLGRNTNIALN